MKKKNHMNRREVMAGMSALVASPRLMSNQDLIVKSHNIDLSDPVKNL